MKGFITADIEALVEEKRDFRRVLYTDKKQVLMSLLPGEEIGEEVHETRDQFFRVEQGKGELWIDGIISKVQKDHAVMVPAGARHNIINTSEKSLRLYTLYEHPEHRDGVIQATIVDADTSDEHFDGKTSD